MQGTQRPRPGWLTTQYVIIALCTAHFYLIIWAGFLSGNAERCKLKMRPWLCQSWCRDQILGPVQILCTTPLDYKMHTI